MMTVEDVNKMNGKNSVAFTASFFFRNELTNAANNAKMLTTLSFSPLQTTPQRQ
jgi:hypothetical protein